MYTPFPEMSITLSQTTFARQMAELVSRNQIGVSPTRDEIIFLRVTAGLSQSEFGKLLGYTKRGVQHWEKKDNPTPMHWVLWHKAQTLVFELIKQKEADNS